jgi:hypothetical protein
MILFQFLFGVFDHESDHSYDGDDESSEGQRPDVIAKSSGRKSKAQTMTHISSFSFSQVIKLFTPVIY